MTRPHPKTHFKGALLASTLAAVTCGTALHAEDVLRSLTAFPSTDTTAELYDRFVAEVNEKGAGVVRIDVIGGPEAVPGLQQI